MAGKPIAPRIGRYPPLVVARPNTSILDVMVRLAENRVRHAPIVDEKAKPLGIVSTKDVVNFLGGGDKFRTVLDKYNGYLYEALSREPVETIMSKELLYVRGSDNLAKVVDIMMNRDIGALPVVDEDGTLLGLVSEKHIARLIADTPINVKVRDVMSAPLITAHPMTPLVRVQKVMISKDIRRIVLVRDGRLLGIATVDDILRYYCRGDVIERLRRGLEDWVMNTPIGEIAESNVVTARPDMEISEAMDLMRKHDVGSLPVVDEKGAPVGIITERDVLLKLPKIVGIDVFVDTINQTITIGWIFY